MISIQRLFLINTFVAILLIPNLSLASDVSATVRQIARPVLIRNDHNTLLQLTIDAKEPFEQIRSISVTLKGAEDLESVGIYFTGEENSFSSKKLFGERLAADKNIVFKGHARLAAGKNHFWLSCRVKALAELSNLVDAAVESVNTSTNSIVPKDETPNIRKRIGIALRRHWDDGVHTYRIPALATTRDNTLLCVYDMRRREGRDLQEDIDIGLLRSTDGGRSWHAQQVIMDMGTYADMPQEENGVSDPGLIVDPATGKIFCFAVWMNGRPGQHQWRKGGSEPGFEIGGSAQILMVSSTDDGQSWSQPNNMTREWKKPEWILYAPSPQQGIALSDGTLVMPTQGRDAEDRIFSNLLVSQDHGESWEVSEPSYGSNECQAVQLSDGSIMLNCRSQRPMKFRTVQITTDLGQSWKPHSSNRKALIEPVCNGSTYRFDYRDDGEQKSVLLFANPHSQAGRTHHSLQVSLDEGKSWSEKYRVLLDEGRGAGYPSISRIDERHIGIVYEGSGSQLVFEKFSIDELLKK